MSRARRTAPPVDVLAALARVPVPVTPAPTAAGRRPGDLPDLVLYTPATLPLARNVITYRAARERGIVVAVSSFGRWRHGVLVDVGRSKLRVAFVTAATPDVVHDRAELPEHVWIAVGSLPAPALPTPNEEPTMPGRTRKPTTTAAEAAATATPTKAPRSTKPAAAPGVQTILTASEAGAADATFIAALPVGRIIPSPDNPRDTLPDLEELRDSIAEHGVLEPVVVAEATPAPDHDGVVYDLVFGHRRLAAAQAAGLTTVPAVVRNDLVDRRAQVARLVENLQRADLSPLEEARAIKALVDGGLAQKDVAVAISRNPGHVTKRLLLLKLPPVGQQLVDAGELPLDIAVDWARLPEPDRHDVAAGSTNASAIAGRVASRAAEVKNRHELDRVVRELDKGGLTVIRYDSYPSTSLQDGPYLLARLREHAGYDVPADHRNLPCHAAMVAPSHYLGYQPAADVADDPLAAHYRLVCTAPVYHRVDTDAPAGNGASQPDPQRDAERAARDARLAAVADLLTARWGQAVRALERKTNQRDQLERSRHTHAVTLVNELSSAVLEENAWSLTAALLAGDPEPGRYTHTYGGGDRAALPALPALLELLPAGADLERFAYAHALAIGHHDLGRLLRMRAERPDATVHPEEATVASLHLRHLIDLAGGGIPADDTEQVIVLAGADLRSALTEFGLLPEPADEADEMPPAAGDDQPGDEPDATADRPVDEPDLRRAELGVTREAEADYGVRIGGGQAYLIPGLKTAKGQCSRCHAQVSIRTGGLAGKHTNDGGTCPGTGDPVMTLDQALPEEATGEPADEPVDEVACGTCEGVGRDGQDRRCPDCAGRGLVPATAAR